MKHEMKCKRSLVPGDNRYDRRKAFQNGLATSRNFIEITVSEPQMERAEQKGKKIKIQLCYRISCENTNRRR